MKELTIEGKAKAYDEALKYGRYLIDTRCKEGSDGYFHRSDLQKMFPGIEENEEQVAQKLYELLCAEVTCEQFEKHGLTVDSALYWLEKQGNKECALKSSKDEDVHKFVQYIEKQAKAYEINLPNRSYDIYAFAKDIFSWLEKQGEKGTNGNEREIPNSEQNPAWSEEDWDYYAAIIAKLEVTQDDALLTDNQMEFLKSLKNRVLPQPKQEWSEEDADAIGMAIIALDDMYDPDAPNNTYAGYSIPFNKAAERLKLIKKLKHWKPSDKQLEALDEVIRNRDLTTAEYNGLLSLWEDIKEFKAIKL